MAKIKSKPTPAQARILRALDENLGLFVGFARSKGWWSGNNQSNIRRELGNPRASTMRRMKLEEWIEPVDADTKFWSWHYTISEDGRQAISGFSYDDFIPPAPKMTSREVLEILEKDVFPAPWWMFVRELGLGDWRFRRRVDAFALRVAVGVIPEGVKGIGGNRLFTSWALEIKVTHEDFLRELSDPRKRIPAMDISHRFAFVAPAGIIQKDEIPEGCGLIEIDGSGKVFIKVHAAYAPPKQPDWRLVASIARAMMK